MTDELLTTESTLLADPPRSRVDSRTTWLVVAVFAVLAGVTLWAYGGIERELDRTLEQKLVAVLSTSERAAEKWLVAQEVLVTKLAHDPSLLAALNEADPLQRRDAVDEALSPLTRTGLIAHYAIFDRDGRLLAPADGPRHPPLPRSAWDSQRRDGVTVQLADEGAAHGWAGRITAWARLGSADTPRGYVALCVAPNDPASGLPLASWGRTGKTFAFDANGRVLAASPISAREGSSISRARPGLADSVHHATGPWLDLEGTRFGNDEVGAAMWLPEAHWGVGVVVARSEAHESVAVLRRAFLVLIVLIVGALFAFLALGRWSMQVRDASVLVSLRLGRLARAIQPLSAALEHDPGAVVLVDDLGSVVYANAAARTILGVDAPLIGKSAHEVFEHLHSELRDAVISGVEAIVAHRPGHDDETLLVTSRTLRIEGKLHVMYSLRPVTREVRRQEVEHWKKLIRVLSHELNNTLAPIT
ncbi:MAG TPA: PAS domain-containing protein, partial [Polyangiaceae bacterium]|nr:PAS domain-containing protein [Polyangiaceae bacterium]